MVKNMILINNFILYSILGYIFETITALIFGINSESGFMYGPYTIVYGIGITLIYLLYNKMNKIKPNLKKVILMFLSGFITFLLLEFLGGYSLKTIYNLQMWNYTNLPLNIGKYISIEITTLWTLGSLFLYFYIKPITDKITKKIPKLISLGILIIMIIDFTYTTIKTFI